MRPLITALALTFNNESIIEKYIESLHFADEIIFIDAFSTDNTVAIAKGKGVKVIQKVLETTTSQRNFALQQATNDWIVFFDVDEIISTELSNEIIQTISNAKNKKNAFFVKRNFIFQNTTIKFGNWYKSKVVCVFNKKYNSYNETSSNNEVLTNGSIGTLKNKTIFNPYESFDKYNHKLNIISKLEALDDYKIKKKPNFYHFFILPSTYFFYHYIVRLGFLDKKEGFILTYIHTFSVFKRYLQLWMMYRKIE